MSIGLKENTLRLKTDPRYFLVFWWFSFVHERVGGIEGEGHGEKPLSLVEAGKICRFVLFLFGC